MAEILLEAGRKYYAGGTVPRTVGPQGLKVREPVDAAKYAPLGMSQSDIEKKVLEAERNLQVEPKVTY
ncbi:MAG TPA: hypothetical protein VKC53_01960 [Patescibacteria group bacterium]|nr:hypothetical protein [Patescibacteria group bacterium]